MLAYLENKYKFECFKYYNKNVKFTNMVRRIFKKIKQKRKYGIYIIKQRKEILYIGKGGTIDQKGRFKKQGLLERLTNTRKRLSANKFFSNLCKKGPITIECIFLPKKESLVISKSYFCNYI
jgi:hypothetical protein